MGRNYSGKNCRKGKQLGKNFAGKSLDTLYDEFISGV